MNKCDSNTELSSHEGTRCQFKGGRCAIKLRIDVHQDFYVVVMQEDLANPEAAAAFCEGSVSALGGQAQEPGWRSLCCLRSVWVWFFFAATTERALDQLLRGLSAKIG